jgi:DNA-directed RNA polymerase specialized sigma24 family protein
LQERETTAERHPISRAAPDLETEVIARAETADFLRWFRRMIQDHPRARDQFLAVAMKYLEERPIEEIATELHTSVNNVYVLISRGLAKLRQEYQKLFAKVQDS